MKRIIVITWMLLLGAVLYAHPVTPEKALQEPPGKTLSPENTISSLR